MPLGLGRPFSERLRQLLIAIARLMHFLWIEVQTLKGLNDPFGQCFYILLALEGGEGLHDGSEAVVFIGGLTLCLFYHNKWLWFIIRTPYLGADLQAIFLPGFWVFAGKTVCKWIGDQCLLDCEKNKIGSLPFQNPQEILNKSKKQRRRTWLGCMLL